MIYPDTNPRGNSSAKAAPGERRRSNRRKTRRIARAGPGPRRAGADRRRAICQGVPSSQPADEAADAGRLPSNPLRGPENVEAAARRIEFAPPAGSNVPAVYHRASPARE